MNNRYSFLFIYSEYLYRVHRTSAHKIIYIQLLSSSDLIKCTTIGISHPSVLNPTQKVLCSGYEFKLSKRRYIIQFLY